MLITSLQNPRIKNIAKVRRDARQRRKDGLMLVEGLDEINLAQAAGFRPLTVLYAEELAGAAREGNSGELIPVSATVFKKLSFRENPDGWLAVFPVPTSDLRDLKLSPSPLLVVVESLEKPGNLGAILRTCDAAGVEAVLVCDPKADLYGPNVVRASRGTVFSVPLAVADGDAARAYLHDRGIRIAAASPGGTIAYTSADLRGALAIAVGTEDRGLSSAWMSQADVIVRIPMLGKVNSLNVSVATALLVYEAIRQRAG